DRASLADHSGGSPKQRTGGLCSIFPCQRRRLALLRSRPGRHLSSCRHLCRSHSARREAGGATGSAADQILDGREPQDRQGAWPCRTPFDFASRRRGDRMRRREFIGWLGSTAATWPFSARAQQPTPMRRIGWLSSVPEDYPEISANFAEFRKGLAEFGWVEGRNIRIDYRWYAGDRARLSHDAAELVGLSPDLIVANGGAAVGRLLEVTRTVPIVFVEVNDPVARGFVESLRRSGGNATGFTHLEYETSAKWLEMLKQIAPILTRVAVLGNFSISVDGRTQLEMVRSAAPSLGVLLEPYEVSTAGDIKRAIEGFVRGPTDGMIVTQNIQTVVHRDLIVQ